MAAKRGKSQARRNGGGNNGSIPGWAWMVLGILLAVVVIIVAPKYLKSDGDGFFRPQPNPDAQPVAVTEDEDAVAPEGNTTAPRAERGKKSEAEEYDFYTLLPGKEVPLSDAEIAATERAEAQRQAARQKQQAAAQTEARDDKSSQDTLPKPVDSNAATVPTQPTQQAASTKTPSTSPNTAPAAGTTASTASAAAAANVANDNTRYLLQAGAFQASGQAEEMKARIAMLGLGARVESAEISGKTVYRVRMGPYGTAGDLAEAKRKLSAGGLQAMAIKVK